MPTLEAIPDARPNRLLHPVVLQGISRTYRLGSVDVPALVDINLVILPDRFTVISGPSGSGKTTLLSLIGCIDGPDAGTLLVGGKPLQAMSDDALSDFRARHLGSIFQNFNLLAVLTAFENVEYPLVLAGVAPGKRRARVERLLEAVGLAPAAMGVPPRGIRLYAQRRPNPVRVARALRALILGLGAVLDGLMSRHPPDSGVVHRCCRSLQFVSELRVKKSDSLLAPELPQGGSRQPVR